MNGEKSKGSRAEYVSRNGQILDWEMYDLDKRQETIKNN